MTLDLKVDVRIQLVVPPGLQQLLDKITTFEPEPLPPVPTHSVHPPAAAQSDFLEDTAVPAKDNTSLPKEDYKDADFKFVPGSGTLMYAEWPDGRLAIQYFSGKINTTWEEIHQIANGKFKHEINDAIKEAFGVKSPSNQYTAARMFVKAVKSGMVHQQTSQVADQEDPDADFRPLGLANSSWPPKTFKEGFGNGTNHSE